jgi:hypothetical protein
MKVYLGNYVHTWTTQRAEHWWFKFRYDKWDWEVEEEDHDWLDRLFMKLCDGWNHTVNRLVNKTWGARNRVMYVKIDNYDYWSADHTLALIIYPLLKKLQEKKHGSPNVDDEDVPDNLKTPDDYKASEKMTNGEVDEYWHDRWQYVLGEMIWAFEQLTIDWEEQFYSGETDLQFEPVEGNEKLSRLVEGPNHTFEVDREGMTAHQNRMDNGLRLFGKYYRGLWD